MIAGLTPRRKPAMSQPDAIIRIKNLRLRTFI
ncbi:dihydroneopterin triphosphate 2'-epimerase, partial [Klebsiella pneumoniae]|nr:dihydroneopterin triphosphate 2'-epimerase [Klebsiella pneumoniae]EIW9170078.1 dihydroneopterin triphosphate 2'-epimerase [Klebsiella pneumoniae]